MTKPKLLLVISSLGALHKVLCHGLPLWSALCRFAALVRVIARAGKKSRRFVQLWPQHNLDINVEDMGEELNAGGEEGEDIEDAGSDDDMWMYMMYPSLFRVGG